MEREASMFEPSEMLSSFLASTPLLMESWRFSCLAAPGTTSFVADHIGDDTSYVAFSGLGITPGIIGRSCGNLAALETVANGIFSGLRRDQADPPMVHAGFLHLFLSVYNNPNFQSQEPNSGEAKECLKMAKKLGRTRNLNSANLAIGLSKINPLRAQIEWYKQLCEDSDDQLGYYDAFKLRGASRKDFKVNMNRIKLGQFWDSLIEKLETNQLPHDFNNREKWVCGSHFYKLLVEPLEIAEYYKTEMHLKKGHYLENGRERRFKIFDKWWNDKKAEPGRNTTRSKFASATQDSCFWARVEEARDSLNKVRSEPDLSRRCMLLDNIDNFDKYAMRIIDEKEVSKDVLARNSSYSLFVREWKELKSQSQLLLPQYLS